MGVKSKQGGWNLPWGKNKVGKAETCDSCKEVAQKLQYVADGNKWVCRKCADRPMLAKGSMFGKLRPITAKEHDQQHDFVQRTKFDS